ncbi:MAG: cation:proton antiporter [Ramlibacter sp.]
MLTLQWTLILLVAAVALSAIARRLRVPYPSLLALMGAALVFVPGAPHPVLSPELALALFVAPVLLDAAYDASVRDLRDNWFPITCLVLAAVGVTTVAVAVAVKWLVPDLPWAAAVAVGAITAPPDAAAATAVLKESRPPHRIVQILEGESLFNDASALLVYRVAVSMAMGSSFSPLTGTPLLLGVVAGSVAAGAALGWLYTRLLEHVDDAPSAIVMQFAGTFGVWIASEHVGLSGILTVVAYAITIARRSPATTPARIRLPSYSVWATVVFVLNALAFVLIGLQLGPILSALGPGDRRQYAIVALAVLGVVIASRFAWVMSYNAVARWYVRRFGRLGRPSLMPPTVAGGLIISWCGMRGIVSLASALALPGGEHPFPGRDLILVIAFTVVLGTLVLQGLTLRPLLRWLDLRDDEPVAREVALAHERLLAKALAVIDGRRSGAATALRYEMEAVWSSAAGTASRGIDLDPGEYAHLRQRIMRAAREELVQLRDRGEIGDDAFHAVEVKVDRAEIYGDTVDEPKPAGAAAER